MTGMRAIRLCLLAAVVAAAVPHAAGAQSTRSFSVATNSYTFGQAPDWMPDGKHVLHHKADADGTNQIHIANLDGSGERCLTCGQLGPNMVPDSRPQGDVILFHSWRGTNMDRGQVPRRRPHAAAAGPGARLNGVRRDAPGPART